MAMAVDAIVNEEEDEDDEQGTSCKEALQKYFLQEWNVVKSILDDIVAAGGVADFASVHKIRSIVLSTSSFTALLWAESINWDF